MLVLSEHGRCWLFFCVCWFWVKIVDVDVARYQDIQHKYATTRQRQEQQQKRKKNIGIYDTKKTKHKTYQHKMTLKSYVFSVFFRLVLIYPHVAFDYLQEGWRETVGRVVICHDLSHPWRNFHPGRWRKNWWGCGGTLGCEWHDTVRMPRKENEGFYCLGSLNLLKYCILVVTGRGSISAYT